MGYTPKCIKKPKSKKKNKCRRANNHKNKLQSKLNSKIDNKVSFLMNKMDISAMSPDNWKNTEASQEWLQKHNVVWWKSKCIALENENRILREKLKSLTESINSQYYPQTADQNYDYTNTDATYQYDQNNYDSTKNEAYQYDENNYYYTNTDAYQYDQNNYDAVQNDVYQYDENNYDPINTDVNYYNEDNNEFANNDENCGEEAENNEDDLGFEADENMVKVLEQSFRHKMKLKQGQTNSSIPCNGEENDTEDLAQGPSTSNNNPEVDNAELLYGSASSRIKKMEKSLQVLANQFQNGPKPHYWPNIPFHFNT